MALQANKFIEDINFYQIFSMNKFKESVNRFQKLLVMSHEFN